MAALVPNDTLLSLLDGIVSNQFGNTATARLLADDSVDILTDNDPASYTECTFTGYVRVTLNAWEAAVLISGNYAQKGYPQFEFTYTGGSSSETIYGLMVVNGADNKVLYAQYFTSPIVLTTTDDCLPIDMVLQLLR